MTRAILICMLVVGSFCDMCFSEPKPSSEANDWYKEMEEKGLAGLEGVDVSVEALHTEFEQRVISRESLQSRIALRLRKAGIKVLTAREGEADRGAKVHSSPLLGVNLNVLPIPEVRGFAVNMEIHVAQFGRLERDPKVLSISSTWMRSSIGIFGWVDGRAMLVRLDDLVDEFINAFLAANPNDGRKVRE